MVKQLPVTCSLHPPVCITEFEYNHQSSLLVKFSFDIFYNNWLQPSALCLYLELWMHLENLESTEKVFPLVSKLPNVCFLKSILLYGGGNGMMNNG